MSPESTQLELPIGAHGDEAAGGRSGLRDGLALVSGRLLHWMPTWLCMALFAQIALGGLRPAIAEEARLAREERLLETRMARLREAQLRLLREKRALADPFFRERVRRLAAAGRPMHPLALLRREREP